MTRAIKLSDRRKRQISRTEARPGSRGPITGDRAAIAAFTSALGLALIPLLGPTGVLLFIASGGVMALLNWNANVRTIAKFWWLFAFPVVAILSTFWSDAPQQTMRAGLQLLITFGIAVLVARNLSPRVLIVALFVGAVALCGSAIPNIPRSLETGAPLTSSFLGSKNQIGFAAFLLFATALAICVDRQQSAWLRLGALVALPTSLWIAYESQSGGGTVSILLAAALFPMFFFLTFLRPRGRIVLSAFGVFAFSLAALFRLQIEQTIASFRAEVLAKNETLTGRTYLWDVGNDLWQARPMLGYGYAAFWRHGNLEAEALWRWGGISSRSGFSFHNVIIETKVDLGLVGTVILLLTLAAMALVCIWRQLRDPTVPGAFYITAFFVLLLRSTIEDGLVSQFSLLALIWIAGGVYAMTHFNQQDSLPSGNARRERRISVARKSC